MLGFGPGLFHGVKLGFRVRYVATKSTVRSRGPPEQGAARKIFTGQLGWLTRMSGSRANLRSRTIRSGRSTGVQSTQAVPKVPILQETTNAAYSGSQ